MKKGEIFFIYLFFILGISFGQTYQIILKTGDTLETNQLRYVRKGKIIAIQTESGIKQLDAEKDVKEVIITKFPKDRFIFTRSGISPYVVLYFDSIPREKLYGLVKDWIKESYRNPEEVIKAEIQNKKIRFEGYNPNAITIGGIKKTGAFYTVIVEVKDNKLRIIPLELFTSYVDKYDILDNAKWYFRKNGYPKLGQKQLVKDVEILFNNLALSLKNYIEKNKNANQEEDEEDDW